MSKLPEVSQALDAVVSQLGGQERSGQIEMSKAISEAIAKKEHLLVEAGTGTGKSLGYLVPACLHAANGVDDEGHGRTIIATATLALQRQLVEKDAPSAIQAIAPLLSRTPTFAVYKGRFNYVCQARLNGAGADTEDEPDALIASPTSELGRQVKKLVAWAKETQTGDRDELTDEIDHRVWRSFAVTGRECVGATKCDFGQECFAENARLEAHSADIVITNHALLALDIQEELHILPEHDLVIIDEAHELVDRTTNALSGSLEVRDIERAAGLARKYVSTAVHERLLTVADDLQGTLSEFTQEQMRLESLPDRLMTTLTLVRDATRAAERDFATVIEDPQELLLATRAKSAIKLIADSAGELLSPGSLNVKWFTNNRSAILHYAPLSVSGFLASRLFDQRTCVLTSATLKVGADLNASAKLMGIQSSSTPWRGLDVGSPFDYAKQAILYCPANLAPPGRDGIAEAALDELGDLIHAAGGRTLALFSSWRAVERAAEYLQVRFGDNPDLPLIVAKRGDSISNLVTKFTNERNSSLLGTVSLWQGIDVPGDTCSLVVIDRIPFPRPDDPVFAARSAAVDESGGSGFATVSLPKAALLLAQGVGRLIRSEADRGVVAVLDSRLANASYSKKLRASLPGLWWTTDRATVLNSLANLREDNRP